MGGTYSVVMGDRGRLVVPAELREKFALRSGDTLLMIETPSGIVMATRDQAKEVVRQGLRGSGIVQALLAERRAAAREEDAA